MHSVLKKVKICICAALMALIFPMSVYAGSDGGPAEEADSGFMTLEEIVKEEPDIMEQVQATAAEQEDEQMTMAVEIKGNQALYVVTFKEAYSAAMTESMAQGLEEGLNEMESAFSALAEELDEVMGAEKGTVSFVVRFCDIHGRILAEADFKAK